jgi:hypothetical protein
MSTKSNSATICDAQADACVPTKIINELINLVFNYFAHVKSASILGVLVPITIILGFNLATKLIESENDILSATQSINLH